MAKIVSSVLGFTPQWDQRCYEQSLRVRPSAYLLCCALPTSAVPVQKLCVILSQQVSEELGPRSPSVTAPAVTAQQSEQPDLTHSPQGIS